MVGQALNQSCPADSSAQTDLSQNPLAGEQLGGQSDHKPEHGQTAVPGFSEIHKTEAGLGCVGHSRCCENIVIVTLLEDDLTVVGTARSTDARRGRAGCDGVSP